MIQKHEALLQRVEQELKNQHMSVQDALTFQLEKRCLRKQLRKATTAASFSSPVVYFFSSQYV